jgi:hypothetical protein
MKPRTRKLLTTAALSTGVVLIPACIPIAGIAAPLGRSDAGLSMDATAAVDAQPDHGPPDGAAPDLGHEAAADGSPEGG